MSSHAILSPSSASRWLACHPSARLEEGFEDTSGDAAKEGTVAHSLGEAMIRNLVGMIPARAYKKILKEIKESEYYSGAMYEHCENYANYVVERYYAAKDKTSDAILLVEQKLDLRHYVPEGFGTGDVIIIADGTLEFIDLKYGKGVPVSAIGNKQLRMYALGALREYDFLYDISAVRMVIYQPRLDSVSVDEMSYIQLIRWGEDVLIPAAKIAFEGGGELVPGEHCRFCKVKHECKALADQHMGILEYTERDAALIPLDRISEIIEASGDIAKWLTTFKDYWLAKALAGEEIPNMKLVNGRGSRVLTDPIQIESILVANGYPTDKILKPKEMYGITELEKVVGKKKLGELAGDYIIRKDGAPTLVGSDDPREAFKQSDPFDVPYVDTDFI